MNNLVLYPNPILSKPTTQVVDFNEEIHKILDNMREIMLKYNGLGLASNQLGYNYSMFIMKEANAKKEGVIEFINPKIVETSNLLVNAPEGCLSAPGVYVDIVRPQELLIEAYNRYGEVFKGVLYDIEARCAAHELEHLEGKFFLDKVNRQQRRAALRKLGVK